MILPYVLKAENESTEVARCKINLKNPLSVPYENTDKVEKYIKVSPFL